MKKLILLSIASCFWAYNALAQERKIPEHIGIIEHNPSIDTLGFELCHEDLILPYFHHLEVSFEGEKPALVNQIKSQFKASINQENGYITIRFVVNCKGESGRFRVIQLDKEYQLTTFSNELISQLYNITTSLKGWDVFTSENNGYSYDYIRYLTFKIENGELKDIMP